MRAGGLDPTVVVGGRVDALGSNAKLGTTQYLVAEADESDRSFLKLSPILAVVTNLDREHMDCYRDMDDVEHAFLTSWIRCRSTAPSPPALTMRHCGHSARLHRRVFTYGEAKGADYLLKYLDDEPGSFSRFLVRRDRILGPFELHVPGRHNALNATAAVAIADQLGVPGDKIADGSAAVFAVSIVAFRFAAQRGGVTVVDDYGHHPTEIRATLAAARECGHQSHSCRLSAASIHPHTRPA